MSPIITMHSKNDCVHCSQARAFFATHAIPYTEIKHDDEADRQALYDQLGLVGTARTVPQIVMHANGDVHHIGGMRQLGLCGLPSLFGDLKPIGAPVARAVAVSDAVVEDDGVCEACQ